MAVFRGSTQGRYMSRVERRPRVSAGPLSQGQAAFPRTILRRTTTKVIAWTEEAPVMTHEEAVSTLAAERYLLNEMTETDRQTFEEHYFDCEVCADDMRSTAAMLQGAKAGYAGTGTTTTTAATATGTAPAAGTPTTKASSNVVPMIPKPPSSRPVWYRAATLPWAAAA